MNTVKQSYLEHENLTGCSRTLSGELRTSPMSQKLSPENLKDTVHLLYFASKGNADAVREILNDGVDVNLVDYDGRTALHLAASEGKTDVIELLVSAGAEINPMDRWGNTVRIKVSLMWTISHVFLFIVISSHLQMHSDVASMLPVIF